MRDDSGTSQGERYEMCPICSSPVTLWRTKNVDNKNYRLDLCKSCGYAFVNPRPAAGFLKDYYVRGPARRQIHSLESVLEREWVYPNSTVDAKRLIKTVKALTGKKAAMNFLDVGCGYGFFSKAALTAGFRVTALELAENEINVAREMTGLNPIASSFEEFECAPEFFNVILMSQVLEHAADIN